MNRDITIFTQTEITDYPKWIVAAILLLCIVAIIISWVVCLLRQKKDPDKAYEHFINTLLTITVAELVLSIIFGVISCTLLRYPTGKYKYSGDLPDDMTIVEYEEFQQTYTNVKYENGIWYWEDK